MLRRAGRWVLHLSNLRVRGLGVLFAAVFGMAGAPAHAGQGVQDVIGFVVDLSGSWTIRGEAGAGAPVRLGQGVPQGSRIRPVSPGALVTIAFFDGATLRCPGARECGKPLRRRPVKGENATVFSLLADAVAKFFAAPEGLYIPAMSRGAAADLEDAVVELSASRLDLTPVLARSRPGQRVFLLERAGGGPPVSSWQPVREIEVDWQGSGTVVVSAEGVAPGLFRLVELDLRGDREPTGQMAWILVAGPAGARGLQNSFLALQKIGSAWGEPVDPKLVAGLLRAGLESLAGQRGAP